jgi:hypothetical protein
MVWLRAGKGAVGRNSQRKTYAGDAGPCCGCTPCTSECRPANTNVNSVNKQADAHKCQLATFTQEVKLVEANDMSCFLLFGVLSYIAQ